MRSVEENIEALTRTVLNDVQAEADRLLADAQTDAETMRAQAHEQADDERDEILARAKQEAAHLRSQAIASAHLQARTDELARRESLLDSVFDAVQQQLPNVAQRNDYDRIARHLLRDGLKHLGADKVLIRADELTRAQLTNQVLDEIAADMEIQVQHGSPLEQGVGLIVQTTDGHRQYDNTLEARLDRMQNALRAPVLRVLTGEMS
jgi:vacuolar-type H+-ATPase subunit E/Vma4